VRHIRPFELFSRLGGNNQVIYFIPTISGTESETISSLDTMALISAARIAKAETILELGTGMGQTALHLALNLPATITTIDLKPLDNPPWQGLECASKITTVSSSMDKLAPSAYDMVFCDINYSLETTREATRIADLSTPNLIAWHDYHLPHVREYLDSLPDLVHVEESRMVFWFRNKPPF
jgi:hypothetical protein